MLSDLTHGFVNGRRPAIAVTREFTKLQRGPTRAPRAGGVMKIEGRPTVSLDIVLRLSEQEARALEAITGYGADAFLKVFYNNMGMAYLKPHEAGLRELFNSVYRDLGIWLRRADDARNAFFNGKPKPQLSAVSAPSPNPTGALGSETPTIPAPSSESQATKAAPQQTRCCSTKD